MSGYPSRPQFFGHRFVRLLAKAAAAQCIGSDGCWLLTVVAMLEDAKRYSEPVTFYNSQLMEALGIGSKETLGTIRTKAVKQGWLHYKPGRKGVPGEYWVTIPERMSGLFSTKIEPQIEMGSEIERQPDGNPDHNPVTSIPNPNPIPLTATAVAAVNGKPKKKSKARSYSTDFEQLWAVYWNRKNKAAAADAFPAALDRIIDDSSLPPTDEQSAVAWLVQRTSQYARLRDDTAENLHAGTYLNQDRFLDELVSGRDDPPPPPKKRRRRA